MRFSRYVESREHRRRWAGLLLFLLAAIVLAGCTQAATSSTPVPTATATPTPIPTATTAPTPNLPIKLENGVLPDPDPDRLAKLSRLLTLVPADFGTAVFVDVQAIKDSPLLQSEFDMAELGLPAIVSSTATNLLNGVGVVEGPEGEGTLAVLDGPIDVESLLQLAGGFGFALGAPEPEPYRDHRVWNIDVLGLILAVGEADANTAVFSSGLNAENVYPLDLVKGSLDSFDGLAPGWLDEPVNDRLLKRLPSGFVTTLLARCGELAQLAVVIDLPGCAGAAVSAQSLGADGVVLYGLVAFEDETSASAGLELALERIEAEGGLLFGDVTVGLEEELVWTRVLLDTSQVGQALRALSQPTR